MVRKSWCDEIDVVIDNLECDLVCTDTQDWEEEAREEWSKELKKVIDKLKELKEAGDKYVDNDPTFFEGPPRTWRIVTYMEDEIDENTTETI